VTLFELRCVLRFQTWRNHRAWFAQFAMPTDYNDALHVEQRSNWNFETTSVRMSLSHVQSCSQPQPQSPYRHNLTATNTIKIHNTFPLLLFSLCACLCHCLSNYFWLSLARPVWCWSLVSPLAPISPSACIYLSVLQLKLVCIRNCHAVCAKHHTHMCLPASKLSTKCRTQSHM
jgi:hypothetical protein